MSLFRSIKAAFLNRWNLLFFGAGLAAAALSGYPIEAGLLVLAGEIAYLGFLGANPRFQKYVAAQEAKARRQEGTISPELAMRRLLESLPPGLIQRFEGLRNRCRELRQLALELRDPQQAGTPQPLENLQLAGLDRLLWIYLRLLFTQHSLERFLQKTSLAQLDREVLELQRRLEELRNADTEQRQKLRKSIEDNLETTRARQANCRKAKDNLELVQVEIERLENKIRALSEMAVNRHEPDFIAGQVDQVVSGMVQTEQTMNELQFLTGLDNTGDEVPEMLRREVRQRA